MVFLTMPRLYLLAFILNIPLRNKSRCYAGISINTLVVKRYRSFMRRLARGASGAVLPKSALLKYILIFQHSNLLLFHMFGTHVVRHGLARARKTIFSAI